LSTSLANYAQRRESAVGKKKKKRRKRYISVQNGRGGRGANEKVVLGQEKGADIRQSWGAETRDKVGAYLQLGRKGNQTLRSVSVEIRRTIADKTKETKKKKN